jgi:hypothetical protein
MPKFIGCIITEAKRIQDDAAPNLNRVKLSYNQARLLPPEQVICSMDTSDRGSKNCLAKRWYIWYAHPLTILACPRSTEKMKLKAWENINKINKAVV